MSLRTEAREALAQYDDGEAGTLQVSALASAVRRWVDPDIEAAAALFSEGAPLHWVLDACGYNRVGGSKLAPDALVVLVLAAALGYEEE